MTVRPTRFAPRRERSLEAVGEESDATVAVLAHGLLTSISVVRGVLSTLEGAWDQLSVDERQYLLERGEAQAAHIAAVLTDLVRSLPQATVEFLDALAAKRTPE
jgi:hypothetical protein